MPHTDDRIYGSYKIDTVVIAAVNDKKRRLLATSGEVYYHNTKLWREALRYMQKIGDRKAEQQIFMKRVSYANHQAAKGIFIGMGLVVGAVATVGTGSVVAAHPVAQAIAVKTWAVAKPVWAFHKASTGVRAVSNGVAQGLIDEEGFRGIDVISPISEGLGFGFSLLTNAVEFRPFNDRKDRRFRIVGYNKSITELSTDIGVQGISGGFRKVISKGIREQFKNREATTMIINNLFSPASHLPHTFITTSISNEVKNKLSETLGSNE